MKFCFFVVERMDSIKRWENSDLFKMPTMPDILRLVTSSGYKSGWFIKQVCQKQPNSLPGLSHVENWHNPVALNPLNFSSCHWLNLHESSFTATLLGWHGGTGGMLPPVAPSHYWVSLTCRSLVGNPLSPSSGQTRLAVDTPQKVHNIISLVKLHHSAGKYRKLVLDHIWLDEG